MFHYMYEIKNNMNGKIYIGVHRTKNMNDGYMGSGKVIKAAIAKYGVENFTKRIIEEFESNEEMFIKERETVSTEFVLRDDTYNLAVGGSGGSILQNRKSWEKGKTHSEETKLKMSVANTGKKPSAETIENLKRNHWVRTNPEAQKLHAIYAKSKQLISYERKQESNTKTSKTLTGRVQLKVVCPQCGKSGGRHAMKRWHFGNCKKFMVDESEVVERPGCEPGNISQCESGHLPQD